MDRHGLVERARDLAPVVGDRASEAEELRRIPDETMKDLHGAGLFRALQPARYGGLEADPVEFFDAVVEIGAACGSTAWVLSVVAVHSWQLALFAEEAQADVWGEDDTATISSSYAPTGTVEPVEGGYVLDGRWHFSSGCDHTAWAFLGGVAPKQSKAPPPDMRTFLLPASDYRIDDNWHVAGLRGSGSKDIVVERAFVPEHRSHAFSAVLAMDSPGNAVNTSPLFRIPFGGMFCNAIATPSLGVAQGVVERYTDYCSTRVMSDRSKAVEDPFAQARIAELEAAVDGARCQLRANLEEMKRLAEAGDAPTMRRRARYRWDAARMTRIATEVVDSAFGAAGGRALFTDNPMQRALRDVHAMRGHANNNPEKTAQMYGRAVLGLPNKEFLL